MLALIETSLAVLIAYLFGSISSAIIVCKLMRLPDPRTQGSRNPGATNVLRIGGKKAALITLAGDMLKGVIPVLLTKWYGLPDFALAAVMLAAFLGHLFPIFFKFEGGKGVATALGCLLALSLPLGLCWMATWIFIAVLFRYSSLAALVASLLVPFYAWFITADLFYVSAIIIMSLLLIWRHQTNIMKLWQGQESKIGSKSR